MDSMITLEQFKDLFKNGFSIRVENLGDNLKEIMIFGSAKDLLDTWRDKEIFITIFNNLAFPIHYVSFKTAIFNYPIRVVGLNLTVNKPAQFANVLELYEEEVDRSGTASRTQKNKRILQPINYRATTDQNVNEINARGFELIITKNIYIKTVLNPHTWITFCFDNVRLNSELESGLTFSQALEALKASKKVSCHRWGMGTQWIAITSSSIIFADKARSGAAKLRADEMAKSGSSQNIRISSHIDMYDSHYDHINIGWHPEIDDLLAEDWCILD